MSKIHRTLIVSALLFALTVLVFWPVTHFQFLSYDDRDYVADNSHVLKGLTLDNLKWAVTSGHAANWHPVTWLSHLADVQLFGTNPAGHHLVNLLLHALNAVLLFLLLKEMTGCFWRSSIVAALFALHPLHVESVAWVAERKDVLSGLFFLLTLVAWTRYAKSSTEQSRVEGPGNQSRVESRESKAEEKSRDEGRGSKAEADTKGAEDCRTPRPRGGSLAVFFHRQGTWYVLAIVAFTLGLMSKPMLVTLPFVLLLLDFWPLGRLQVSSLNSQPSTVRRLLLEKLPFFILSAASCVVTVLVQKAGGAVQTLHTMSMGSRLENAVVSYARYLGKAFWPFNLAAPYPHPLHWPVWTVAGSAALVLVLTILALRLARRAPFLVTGWFWFVGMLVPVIGILQVGEQSMADRYTYLPLIGVFVAIVWGAASAVGLPLRLSTFDLRRSTLVALAVMCLIGCALRTRDQVFVWRDSIALFRHAVSVTTGNFIAWYNLGHNLEAQGHRSEAIACYRKTAEIQPYYTDGWNNLGVALASEKQYGEAIKCFETVLARNPKDFEARQNLGEAFLEIGKTGEAIAHFRLALEQKPNVPALLGRLGTALVAKGEFLEATQVFEAALRINPALPATQYGLATAMVRLRRLDEAVQHYELALKYQPDYPEAHHDLGIVLARQGKLEEAAGHLRQAVSARPNDVGLLCALGKVLMAQQRLDEAVSMYEKVISLSPVHGEAHASLGLALAVKGELAPAIEHLRKAIQSRPNDAVSHFNLGKALASQGKTQEAIPEYKEALRLRPDYGQARQELQSLGAQE